MSERTPYPKYQACPCGSGQKYKFCCYTKGFHYYLDDDDDPVRSDDPILPELASLSEDDLKKQMIGDFQKVGIRPVLIYAFEKTGLMVTAQNKHLIPDVDLAAWDDAVEEYYELHPEEDSRTS
jgi:SEC-C motif-containing protein